MMPLHNKTPGGEKSCEQLLQKWAGAAQERGEGWRLESWKALGLKCLLFNKNTISTAVSTTPVRPLLLPLACFSSDKSINAIQWSDETLMLPWWKEDKKPSLRQSSSFTLTSTNVTVQLDTTMLINVAAISVLQVGGRDLFFFFFSLIVVVG